MMKPFIIQFCISFCYFLLHMSKYSPLHISSSPPRPDRLWSPPSLLSNG
jgi:hypothetical protein